MSTEAFTPAGYEAPKSGGGYTDLEVGANPMRVLSNPFMMWTSWTDGKPSRLPYLRDANGKDNKPAKGTGEKDSVKHSWGLVIFNLKTDKIEVFELDKQTIIASLTAYSQNPKWGHPKHYDIVINKSGSGKETKYELVVEPKTPPTQAMVDAFIANPVDLTQLLVEGGNCFIEKAATEPAPAAPAANAAITAAALAQANANNTAATAAAAAGAAAPAAGAATGGLPF